MTKQQDDDSDDSSHAGDDNSPADTTFIEGFEIGVEGNAVTIIYRRSAENCYAENDAGSVSIENSEIIIEEPDTDNAQDDEFIVPCDLVAVIPNVPSGEYCVILRDESGIIDETDGVTVPGPSACQNDADCVLGGYCSKSNGDCQGVGKCRIVSPEYDCTCDYDPVCGCDGKTYSNGCYAYMHEMSVAYDGECR